MSAPRLVVSEADEFERMAYDPALLASPVVFWKNPCYLCPRNGVTVTQIQGGRFGMYLHQSAVHPYAIASVGGDAAE